MESLGRHLMIELWDCNDRIDDPDAFREAIVESVEAIGATLLHLHVHRYSPQGVTGLAILAESHLSLHSWPEHGYLAADVFTCAEVTVPRHAVDVLQRHFEPQRIEVRELARGVLATAAPGGDVLVGVAHEPKVPVVET